MATITGSAAGGNWSSTSAWVGGVVPTAADDVVLDATSGNITVDGTSGSPSLCRSLNQTGYLGTMTMGATSFLQIGDAGGGSMILASGRNSFNSSSNSKITFVSTTTGNTVTWAGAQPGGCEFNGSGGAWTITDAFTVQTSFRMTAGTVTATSANISCGTSSTIMSGGTFNATGRNISCGSSLSISGCAVTCATLTMSTTNITVSGGSLTCTSIVTGNSLTLSNAVTVTCTGAIGLNGNVSVSGTAVLDATGQTITAAGSFSLTGGTVTANNIAASTTWDVSGTSTLTLGSGTSTGTTFTSASGTRNINLGTGTLNFTGSTFQIFGSNLTLNASSATITVAGTNTTFTGNAGDTFYNVSLTNTQNFATISGANIFNNLTITTTGTSTSSRITFNNNVTVNGTLTFNGASYANRLWIRSNTTGTARTLTAAAVSAQYADFQDITGAGAASWNLSAITGGSGDMGGNSGITFTTPGTFYYFRNTGNYSDSTKWFTATNGGGSAGRPPLPQDTGIFDANSFNAASQTVTLDVRKTGTMDWSNASNSPTITSSNVIDVYGSLALKSTMTVSGVSSWTFQGRGSYTIKCDTKALNNTTFDAVTGTYTQQDNFLCNAFTATSGSWVSNGFTMAPTSNVTIQGATVTCTNNFTVTGGTNTITISSGTLDVSGFVVSLPGAFTIGGASSVFKAGTLTPGSSATITVNGGTFWIGSGGITQGGTFTSPSGTRNIKMGSGTWILSGSFSIADTTGLTFDSETSTVRQTSGSPTMTAPGLTMYNWECTALTSTATQNGGSSNTTTFNNVSFTVASGTSSECSFTGNTTINGTLTVNGLSSANRMLFRSNTEGTPRTITLATLGTISYLDCRDITGAGASGWNLSAITGGSGDCGGNSGITFSTPTTYYWSNGTGNYSNAAKWFTATGGGGSAGRPPLPQDTARFDANSFTGASQTVTLDLARYGSLDFTGSTNTPTITSSLTPNVYGSITLVSAMTQTGVSSWQLKGRGSNTITCATQTMRGVSMNAVGGTYTQQDAFASGTNASTFTQGTWNLNNFSCTLRALTAATPGPTINTGTATLTCNTTTVVWNAGTLNASSGGLTLSSIGLTVATGTLNIGTLTAGSTVTSNGGTMTLGASSGTALTVSGGTVTLNGTLTLTGALQVSSGTLDGTGQTITGGTTGSVSGTGILTVGTYVGSSTFSMSSSGTLTVGSGGLKATTFTCTSGAGTINMGSGNWEMTGTGTVWNVSSGTWNGQTSTILISNTSASTKTFTGGGKTYNNWRINGAASNATVTIQGSNTFNTLTADPDSKLRLTAGTTQTVSHLSISGTSGHLVTVDTQTAGSAATISCANNVDVDYVSLKDSTASGNVPFYAGTHSTDVSGNTNWTFTDRPIPAPLAGSANASATATGNLSQTHQLAGAANATASATGGLTQEHELAGAANAEADATGDLIVDYALAGAADAIADATGDIEVFTALAGAADAIADATGELTQEHKLAGAADAIAGATGGLTQEHELAGSANAVASATGDLRITQPLAGAANAVASATGDVKINQPLAGAADANASVTGGLKQTHKLAGAANANASVTGGLKQIHKLAGVISAIAGAIGNLMQRHKLAGDADAIATVTGDIEIVLPLAGAANAVASATGDIQQNHVLAGAANAVASATGDMAQFGPFNPVTTCETSVYWVSNPESVYWVRNIETVQISK